MFSRLNHFFQNAPDWPARLYLLDMSRGIAALAVVFSHWKHFGYEGLHLSSSFQYADQPFYDVLKLFYVHGGIGVEYFFVLSGFIFFWLYRGAIAEKQVSAREFSVHRFSRLYPLHFATLILVALLQFWYLELSGSYYIYPENDLYHFVLNLFFASNWGLENGFSFNGPIWSVSVEILLYALFFIAVLMRLGSWLPALAISLASFMLLSVLPVSPVKAVSLFFFGGVVFYFSRLLSGGPRFLIYLVYTGTFFCWLAVVLDVYFIDLSSQVVALGYPGKVFLIAFTKYLLFPGTICSLALLEINAGRNFGKLAWVGNISYSSYLIHFPMQLLIVSLAALGFISLEAYASPWSLLIFMVVLIALSHLVYTWFERPMQRKLRSALLP